MTPAKDLKEIRCTGIFRGEPCGRILFRATANHVKPGSMVEVKCGKCEQVNYVIGGPAQ